MQVFQLQAEGIDPMTGNGRRRITNVVVFATREMAEKRIEKFRIAVSDRIESPKVIVVPMDVITDEDSELPESFSPSSYDPPCVEKRNEVVYAAGYEEKPGSFGMFDGPTPSIKEILQSMPCGINPCIIRFNLDGTDEVLYRWDVTTNNWKRCNDEGIPK
jgi:hypothetical protein